MRYITFLFIIAGLVPYKYDRVEMTVYGRGKLIKRE